MFIILNIRVKTGPQLRERQASLAREIFLIWVDIGRSNAENSIRRHSLYRLLNNLSMYSVESRFDGARRDNAVNEIGFDITANFGFKRVFQRLVRVFLFPRTSRGVDDLVRRMRFLLSAGEVLCRKELKMVTDR